MLMQGIAPVSPAAVHDTVGALLRDAAYHRSFWSSVAGRILLELGRLVLRVLDAIRSIPGGKTTVLVVLAVVVLAGLARLFLASELGDDVFFRRKATGLRSARRDPWTEAEHLAAAGDYLGAAHALYQAVLRQLSASERLRLHPSKTSGDYVRELRRRGSASTSTFQRFGRRFDHVVFGKGICTAEDFAALRDDAIRLQPREAAA